MAQGDRILIPRENQTNDLEFRGYETGASGEVQEGVVLGPFEFTRTTVRKVTVDDTIGGTVIAPASADRVALRFINSFTNSKIVYWQPKNAGNGPAIPTLTVAEGHSLWGREWVEDRVSQAEYRAICSPTESEVVEVWEIFLK